MSVTLPLVQAENAGRMPSAATPLEDSLVPANRGSPVIHSPIATVRKSSPKLLCVKTDKIFCLTCRC